MSRSSLVVALLAVAALLAVPAIHSFADDNAKEVIEGAMNKFHKGKEAPIQAIIAGKADEAALKAFLEAYEGMAKVKPPQGDEASWKAKTSAVIDATNGLIAKKPDAAAAFKTATDCKACHSVHKPKKEKK